MAEPDQFAADVLAPLRPGYLKRLAERTATLEAFRRALEEARADLAMLRELRALAHNLYGSGSTFGYPAVSESAANVEELVAAILEESLAPASEGERLAERVGTLLGACEAAVSGTTAATE